MFERTAIREKWPEDELGAMLAPFLTGEAQRACQDLQAKDAADYAKLKRAILSHYGHSLPARAQRFHAWIFDPTQPVRPQIATLTRLTKAWLTTGEGPTVVERIVLDCCICSLPTEAKRYAAQTSPADVETLTALLENHQVTVEVIKVNRQNLSRMCRTRGERGGPPKNQGDSQVARSVTPAQGPNLPLWQPSGIQNPRKCYSCGQEGHLSWSCPGREESMPSADSGNKACHYGMTCWASQGTTAPRIPVRVANQDTEALPDSGSMVTLVLPEYALGQKGHSGILHSWRSEELPHCTGWDDNPQRRMHIQSWGGWRPTSTSPVR